MGLGNLAGPCRSDHAARLRRACAPSLNFCAEGGSACNFIAKDKNVSWSPTQAVFRPHQTMTMSETQAERHLPLATAPARPEDRVKRLIDALV